MNEDKAMMIPASYLYPDLRTPEARARARAAAVHDPASAPADGDPSLTAPGVGGALASGAAMLVGIVAYGGLMELLL